MPAQQTPPSIKQQKPEIIVIAGPNGSGKTTITEQLQAHDWAEGKCYINPDNIAENTYDGWNDVESTLKAAQDAEKLRRKYVADGKSFIFETVFSTDEKVKFLKEAKRAGFFVRFFYIYTKTPQINIERIRRRQQQGGHGVPDDKVKESLRKIVY